MDVIRRIRRTIIPGPVSIQPGHVYTDHITDERFEVQSVGRWIELTRFDAERRPDNKVRKKVLQDAIDNGHVEHVADTCPACDNSDV